MRRKLLLGLAALGIAGVAFFAGVLVEHYFPSLFAFQPESPALLSPAEGAVLANGRGSPPADFTWDFSWSEVPRADRYELIISDPAGRSYTEELNSQQFHWGRTNISLPAEKLQGWSWRVRARVGGRWSKWSQTRQFSVEPARPQPQPEGG